MLAWIEAVGIPQPPKTQVALLAGVSPRSGGYFNNLGALRGAGMVHYPSGGRMALTETGRRFAAPATRPPTVEDLWASLEAQLPKSQWRLLHILIEIYPQSLPKDRLAELAGVSSTSGGYFNNLGRLRSLGLIDYPSPGEVVALPVLFLEGS